MSSDEPLLVNSGQNLSVFCPRAMIFVGPDGSRYTDKYSDASAAWVMATSILIFFMKAGFLFVEVAFVSDDTQARRRVILAKYLDTCASAMGFYLFGFGVAGLADQAYLGEEKDYIEWFFRFTFASNTATILHGTLVGHTRKLRMIALFVYAFLVGAFLHPFLAREIWSTVGHFSPYRFCNGTLNKNTASFDYTSSFPGHDDDIFFLDYAGSGAVHMLGGFGGLVLALLCKWEEEKKKKTGVDRIQSKYKPNQTRFAKSVSRAEEDQNQADSVTTTSYRVKRESQQTIQMSEVKMTESTQAVAIAIDPPPEDRAIEDEEDEEEDFIQRMYPKQSSAEFLEFAALGVLILWTTFFAFNCGTTESVSGEVHHAILGRIALNMVVAGGVGGIVATLVALFAQLRHRSRHINTNEIANSILGSLVAITGCCPYLPAERAIVVGIGSVIFYHLGVHAEFRWKIPDTARVFPVHGMCGIWGLLSTGILGSTTLIRETHENVCGCREIPLPDTVNSQGWIFLYQIAAVFFIMAWSVVTCGFVFLVLLKTPMQPLANLIDRVINAIDLVITPCLTVLIACSKPRKRKQKVEVRRERRSFFSKNLSSSNQLPGEWVSYEDRFIFEGGLLITSPEEYGGQPPSHED